MPRISGRMLVNMATRWAICGAGNIARDFTLVLNSLPAKEHQVVAVASRSAEKSAKFAADLNIPKSFGSYEELLTLPDIDIVYIANIHPFHVDTSLLFINAGKNVLCEKPMALSMEGCKKVLDAAREKSVFFLEGYWTRFFPAIRYLQELVSSGTLGEIKLVEASFCCPILEVDRIFRKELGGGALVDIGLYVVLVTNLFLKGKPSVVKAEATYSSQGLDKTGVVLIKTTQDQFACVNYSVETAAGANSLTIRGSKGNAVIPDMFWCPDKVYVNGELKEFPLPSLSSEEKTVFDNSEGFYYEIQCVRDCLQKGLKECPIAPYSYSLDQMALIQDILQQFGIKYDAP